MLFLKITTFPLIFSQPLVGFERSLLGSLKPQSFEPRQEVFDQSSNFSPRLYFLLYWILIPNALCLMDQITCFTGKPLQLE